MQVGERIHHEPSVARQNQYKNGKEGRKSVCLIQLQVSCGCNLQLSSFESDTKLSRARVDFSEKGHEMDKMDYLQELNYVGC